MPFHGLTDTIALFVGFEVYQYMKPATLLVRDREWYGYVFGALVGALVGSRLLAIIADPAVLAAPLWAVLLGQKTIIGAVLGGIVGIECAKKMLGIHVRTGDATVIPLAIAIAIGRVGCQVAGVADGTIGIPCDWWWCFAQGDGIPRHPLPLYEIVLILSTLPAVYMAWKRSLFPQGTLFRMWIVGYLSMRFFFEFLKDEMRVFGVLSVIQIACLTGIVLYGYAILAALSSTRRARTV